MCTYHSLGFEIFYQYTRALQEIMYRQYENKDFNMTSAAHHSKAFGHNVLHDLSNLPAGPMQNEGNPTSQIKYLGVLDDLYKSFVTSPEPSDHPRSIQGTAC